MRDVKDNIEKLRQRRMQREIADAVLLANIASMQREIDCLRKEGLEMQRERSEYLERMRTENSNEATTWRAVNSQRVAQEAQYRKWCAQNLRAGVTHDA